MKREVGVLRAAAGRADPFGADPRRRVPGHVLLEERRLLDAVGPAHHRDRAVAQVRQHHVGDRQVVGEHVGLRGAGERVEHLARVGQLRAPDRGGRGGAPPRGRRRPPRPGCGRPARRARRRPSRRPRRGVARGRRRRPRARPPGKTGASRQCGPASGRSSSSARRSRNGSSATSRPSRCRRSPIQRSPPDELAVEEHGGGTERRAELAQRRRLDLGALGVGDPGAPAVHADDHPAAAEAHLQPPVVAAGERARGGLHRAGVAGERVAVGAGSERRRIQLSPVRMKT